MELRIPKLGVSMTGGVLVEWLVESGATVTVGQVLYRLETDKVENEIEAAAAGVVQIRAAAGETYAVGELVGTIE